MGGYVIQVRPVRIFSFSELLVEDAHYFSINLTVGMLWPSRCYIKRTVWGKGSSRMKRVGEKWKQDPDDRGLARSWLNSASFFQLSSVLNQYFSCFGSFFVICILKEPNAVFKQETLIAFEITLSVSSFHGWKWLRNGFEIFRLVLSAGR